MESSSSKPEWRSPAATQPMVDRRHPTPPVSHFSDSPNTNYTFLAQQSIERKQKRHRTILDRIFRRNTANKPKRCLEENGKTFVNYSSNFLNAIHLVTCLRKS